MALDLQTYLPFKHEDIDYKQKVLELARQQDNSASGIMTRTLIYINAVDYIAQHLLENLYKYTQLITHNQLNGVVFFRAETLKKNITLGEAIILLKQYEFPDKSDFIQQLHAFKELRNKYSHNLLLLTQQELNGIDTDLNKLRDIAEGLLNKYDVIVRAMINVWFIYKNSLLPTETPQIEQPKTN